MVTLGVFAGAGSVRVAEKGARGQARPAGRRAAVKAEAFEAALARVSRRAGTQANCARRQARRDYR